MKRTEENGNTVWQLDETEKLSDVRATTGDVIQHGRTRYYVYQCNKCRRVAYEKKYSYPYFCGECGSAIET